MEYDCFEHHGLNPWITAPLPTRVASTSSYIGRPWIFPVINSPDHFQYRNQIPYTHRYVERFTSCYSHNRHRPTDCLSQQNHHGHTSSPPRRLARSRYSPFATIESLIYVFPKRVLDSDCTGSIPIESPNRSCTDGIIPSFAGIKAG